MENTVNKEMSIGEVLNIHRGTAKIMMEFGMHCLGCPSSRGETVEEACMVHGVNVDALLNAINEQIAANAKQ